MAEIKVYVEFGMGNISIGNETVDNWKTAWKVLRMKLQQGLQRNKMERLSQKNMESEIPRNHTKDDYGWLKCNTDPAKTAAVFSMQEQMVETMAWKMMRRLSNNDQCRLFRKQKETVQHLPAGCKKLASTEYVRRHNNALKVMAVRWRSAMAYFHQAQNGGMKTGRKEELSGGTDVNSCSIGNIG